ncbi:MAG: hypothetical protein LW630_06330 [Saprospiraceae bacterium]|nr:hypothetical protein [Saprospiraceae bacterium]
MRNNLFVLGGLLAAWIFLSNSSGVPQAVTKAPGEANHNSCASCHTPAGSYNTNVTLEVLNSDSMAVTHYQPGQTYTIRLKVTATNNPKAYGFQMACLDSLTNTDYGVWSVLGEKVKQQNLNVGGKQRKYLVQSSPKTSGTFTANWKAPASDVGKMKFYFTGLAVNLNGNTNGDNNKFGQLSLPGPVSSIESTQIAHQSPFYPNPMTDVCFVRDDQTRLLRFTETSGCQFEIIASKGASADVSQIPPGTYAVQGYAENGKILWNSLAIKK